ncbi:MAG: response regulator [Bacteroidota bacterium]
MISAIIIDDERLARDEMRFLLSKYPDIEIVDEASLASVAIEKINRIKPDVVFLDIELPSATGFDILLACAFTPHVVFVTAYDAYAIRAFEENALDYLPKPVRQTRLDKTIEKIRKTLVVSSEQAPLEEKIFIKDGSKCYFIPYKNISHITALGNYARFHFGSDHCLMHQSLRKLEQRLPAGFFIRANRQEIINVNFITGIKWEQEQLTVEIKDQVKVLFSERNAAVFKQKFG